MNYVIDSDRDYLKYTYKLLSEELALYCGRVETGLILKNPAISAGFLYLISFRKTVWVKC